MFDFKQLFNAWRGQGLVSEMFGQFQEMLENAASMLKIVRRVLSGSAEPSTVEGELRSLDKAINNSQQTIRRQILEHLSVNPGVDVPASLVLMSIVKDAERLGDYARDLFRTTRISGDAAQTAPYSPVIAQLSDEVERLLADTQKALADSDEALATDVMGRESGIKSICDKMLTDVAAGGLPADKTTALAVISRYFRRITAHTANIASSVINPIDRLDYQPKGPAVD